MTKLVSKRGREKASIVTVKGKRYTRDQLDEIRKCTSDPLYFLSIYVKTNHPLFGLWNAPIEQHHMDYINTLNQPKSVIAMMPRQSGMTSKTMGMMLWEALFKTDQKIAIQGANTASAKNMCDMMSDMINHLPDFLRCAVRIQRRTLIEFDTGSTVTIGTVSATALKGVTVTRLFVDQFALVPPMIQRDLANAFIPKLAYGCRVILASTPNGKNNEFFNLWNDANKANSVFIPFRRNADDLPYTDAWKKMVKSQVGEYVWRKEFMCEFL